MAILRQRTSFGPGIYRGHRFDLERLRSFVEGTNKAIAAGVPIPLLKRHAPINASDKDTEDFAKEEGAGWVKKVFIEDSGDIGFEADSVKDVDAKEAQEGRLKFTSPEFRPHYEAEKAGVYTGPVIRHFAFTPKPGNPIQSPVEVVALEEIEAMQFDESERQPLETEQFDEKEYHKLLTSHGYKRTASSTTGGGWHEYHKPDNKHDKITVGRSGWHRQRKHIPGKQEGLFVKGNHPSGLASHLKGVASTHPSGHYISQHTEGGPLEGASEIDVEAITKSSMETPTHDQPNTFGQSPKKSIDWDTLTEQNRNIVLDMIEKGLDEEDHKLGMQAKFEAEHGSIHPRNPISGLTGNPVSWVENEGTWEKAKKAVGDKYKGDSKWAVITKVYKNMGGKVKGSQHSEDEFHAVLSKHGYQKGGKDAAGGQEYKHPVGHHVAIYDDDWMHEHAHAPIHGINRRYNTGVGHKSLEAHLTKLHTSHMSQHAEDKDFPPKKDKPEEGVDIDERAGIDNKEQNPETANTAVDPTAPPNTSTPADPNNNPDMPPKATDKSKLQAILAGLAQLGLVLPSTFSFDDESAQDILLASINTKIKADNDSEAEEAEDDEAEGDPVTDAPMSYTERRKKKLKKGAYVMQYTEEELATIPASLKAKLDIETKAREEAEAKATQFEEEKQQQLNKAAKDKAIDTVSRAKIPPGLRTKLLARLNAEKDAIAFTEGNEVPVFTAQEVAKLVEEGLPPSVVQFLEKTETETETDSEVKGSGVEVEQFFEGESLPTGHISADKARAIVNDMPHVKSQYVPKPMAHKTVGQSVAEENGRHPNRVMNN